MVVGGVAESARGRIVPFTDAPVAVATLAGTVALVRMEVLRRVHKNGHTPRSSVAGGLFTLGDGGGGIAGPGSQRCLSPRVIVQVGQPHP